MFADLSLPASLLSLILVLALPGGLPGVTAQQPIRDINTQPLKHLRFTNPLPARPEASREQKFLRMGAWTYLSVWTPDTGAELFRVNGGKTELVKDINPGVDGSLPSNMVVIRGKLYFSAYEPQHGIELWVSDGTAAGTRLFADFVPGPGFSNPNWPTGLSKGRILCNTERGLPGGFYVTDGTVAGTKHLAVPLTGVTLGELRAVNDGSLAYFDYRQAGRFRGVWVTDGTAKGTRSLLSKLLSRPGASFRPSGTKGMLFQTEGKALGTDVWFSLGSAKTTTLLMTLPASGGITGTWPGHGLRWSVEFKGRTWFAGSAPSGVHALFATDGTPKGTQRIATLRSKSTFLSLATDGKSLWFLRNFFLPKRLNELWRTDGTVKGTGLWISLPGIVSSSLCATGGKVFLRSWTSSTGEELWVSDGTNAGTRLVRDIVVGPRTSKPESMTAVAPGVVLFRADDGTSSRRSEAWLSLGSARTTFRLNLKAWAKTPATADDKVHGIVGLLGTVLFSADDGKTGSELWKSDGTAKGTVLVKDIRPGPKGGLTNAEPCRLGDQVLFAANDGRTGREIWVSDGTSQGTRLLLDIAPGVVGSDPMDFVTTKGRVFFTASTYFTRRELWVTDGTAAGTRLVKETIPGRQGLLTQELAALPDGRVLFSSRDAQAVLGMVLWVSDGTAKGTQKIASFRASTASLLGPTNLIAYRGRVYFAWTDAKRGRELWVTDGTVKGTSLFLNIASDAKALTSSRPDRFFVRGGRLYFQATTPTQGRGLWASDGTVAGTLYLSKPGVWDEADSFTAVGSRHTYFSAWDASGRRQLVSMDGQGKVRYFTPINPRGHAWPGDFEPNRNWPAGAHPFTVEDGALWFAATKDGYDRQLFALRAHAVAKDLGDPRASTTLSATDPILGKSATIVAETQVSQPLMIVMLGLPAKKPLLVTPKAWLYYDLASFALPLSIFQGRRLQTTLPIPSDTSLTGVKVMLQTWALDSKRFPLGLELSNAIHWSLGR